MIRKSIAAATRGPEFRILIAFLAAALIGFLFLHLASEVGEGETLAIDRALMLALRTPGNPAVPRGPAWLLKGMTDLTSLGGMSVLGLLTALVAGYLAAAGKRAMALFVVLSVVGGALLGTLLKGVFIRARPDIVPHLVAVSTMSFPSSHAMDSAITYLTLGALLARAEPRRGVRLYIVAAALALTLMVGFSRVYLGVHWPSDVLAGWAVGAAWALFCSAIGATLQRRRRLERPSA